MANDHFQQHLKVATVAAARSAEILAGHLGKTRPRQKSAPQDFVTQADVDAEEAIVSTIQRDFPNDAFLREEGGATGNSSSDNLWIIDPLDGTTNFAHGIPQFCTSIAYVEQGRPVVGVIHDPCRNEVFAAVRGQGATMNGSPIHCSATDNINQAIIATGFYYDRGEMMTKTLAAIQRLFETNIHGIRRFGGAALDQCWVACGRFDGFFEYQLAAWDYAAGWLIAEESGARVVDRDGHPLRVRSNSLIAANPVVFDQFLDHVRWDRENA